MSRIGKKPIEIPQGVEIKIQPGEVIVKGQKGEIKQGIPNGILVEQKDNVILIKPERNGKNIPALWGLTAALLGNNVKGVSMGFEKKLEIKGVGYKSALEGDNKLRLDLGFSHPVFLDIPVGLSVSIEKQFITISGANRQKVGQFSAQIRALRKPEPYQGKGIRYFGEVVRKKEGKKAGK
ncbi:MAG: 50S ribosomal protein L6 [Candidatus Pacebacteria bacterium]|nr:50S ribosomal protein L6 [Candidatus Paceibacterota bacterium]